MNENVVNIQLSGETAAWLLKTAETYGWTTEQVVSELFKTGVELDNVGGFIHEDAAPTDFEGDVQVRTNGEFREGDDVLDPEGDHCKVVRVWNYEGTPTLRLAMGWIESEDDPSKLEEVEDLFDAPAADVELIVLLP